MEIDKFIKFLGTVKDKDVKRLCRKAMQKGGTKALNVVRKEARGTAKTKNNGKNKPSYLKSYKRGRVYQDGDTWKTRAYNKNAKVHFLEKETFSKYHKQGINAFAKSEKDADNAFKEEVNKIVNELLRRF